MKCDGFKGGGCDRVVIGMIRDTKTGRIGSKYCFLHRPAVRDGRFKRYVVEKVT